MYLERGVLYGTSERADAGKAARIARREERVWKRASGFVATTAGIRDAFAERHGPRRGVRVVPNGCDVPSGRAFPGLAHENPPRVLYAGQLYPWKGVDVLVEAMAAVPGARLVILGGIEGEADTRRIRSLVEARGLGERTEMPGPLPQARVAAAAGAARGQAGCAAPVLVRAASEAGRDRSFAPLGCALGCAAVCRRAHAGGPAGGGLAAGAGGKRDGRPQERAAQGSEVDVAAR